MNSTFELTAPGRTADAAKQKILLVDDDPAIRQILVRLLSEEDYLVLAAANGAEALAALESLIADKNLAGRLRSEALRTGLRYSIRSAVWSLLVLFRNSERETGIAVGQG